MSRLAALQDLAEDPAAMSRPRSSPRLQLLLCALIACALPAVSLAEGNHEPPRVRMVWIDTPPEIDGRLDDPAWQQAAVIEDLRTAEPVAGGTPSQRTVVRIMSDRDAMYLAVECYETDPSLIRANRMLRDDRDMFWDDRVNFAIDANFDRRTGYFFQVNAVGSWRDGLIETTNFENNWDGIWYAKVRRTSEGWFAEVAIPYKTLAFDPEATEWGFNFSRGIRRINEDIRWADPVPQRIMTNMSRAGVIEGMGRQRQGIGLDVVPGFTVRRIDDESIDRHKTKIDPTFDAFYRLTPSLTGSLTVNTDFGETEVDEQQVNFERFALFFPEKRDFFLQDALIFDFGGLSNNQQGFDQNGRPFFSRRVGIDLDGEPVNIEAGAKVTGRVGEFNVGLLDVQLSEHEYFDEDATTASQWRRVGRKNLFAGRVSRNVLKESTVGVIVTNGDPVSNRNNTLVGTDFTYRDSDFLGSNKTLEGNLWFQNTFSGHEGADGLEGAWGAAVRYPNDRHFVFIDYRELQADFNPALGFVNRKGIRKYDLRYRFRHRPQSGPLRFVDAFMLHAMTTDRDNELQTGVWYFRPIDLETNASDSFEVGFRRGFERLRGDFDLLGRALVPMGTYKTNELVVELQTALHRRFSLLVEYRAGEFLSGNRHKVLGRIDWYPVPYFRLGLEYDHAEMRLDVLNRAVLPTRTVERKNLRSRVARVRLNLLFSPNVSWLTFVQYDNTSDKVGINSRLRWIVEDGREIFVVFNQTLTAIDGDIESVRTEPLVKVGWTLRF